MTKRLIGMVLVMFFFCGFVTAGGNMVTLSVKLKVPDSAWKISIQEVWLVKGEVWVISQLRRPPMMGATVISTVSDSVKLDVPEKADVKHFILGKRWGWQNEEPYTFIKDSKAFEEKLKKLEKKELYKKPKEK